MNYYECRQIFKEIARDIQDYREKFNKFQGKGRVGRSPDGRRATKRRRRK